MKPGYLSKCLVSVVFSIALGGFAMNASRVFVLRSVSAIWSSLGDFDSADTMRFFDSAPLSEKQRGLLETTLKTSDDHGNIVHKALMRQTKTFETYLEGQAALWALVAIGTAAVLVAQLRRKRTEV